MRVIKCPRCEINFISEDDKYCSICKRELRGELKQEELPDMCIECGENPAVRGEDLCATCLKDRALADQIVDKDSDDESVEEDSVEGIEMSIQSEDIPDGELEVIHKELGLDEVGLDAAEEEDDDEDDSYDDVDLI